MANSTRRGARAKSPAGVVTNTRPRRKANPFPLWLHSGTGQWAKKIRGRTRYFGTDKDAALAEYVRVRDDLEAGRSPPAPDGAELSLLQLVNTFLTHQKHKVGVGEITPRTFADYHSACERLLVGMGKTTIVERIRPDDLLDYRRKLAENRNATSLGNEVQRVRTVLGFAFNAGLIDRPVRFGEFKKPSKRVTRRQRAEKGPRMFDPVDLRKLIDKADPQLRAMILLALNCGFGNQDCGTLPMDAVDLEAGWIDHPRPKTGIARRCPLWTETIEAFQVALDARKAPSDPKDDRVLFVTKYGNSWAQETNGKPSSAITHEFRKLLDSLELYRPGLSFYTLRHVFQTVADERGDYIATRKIMGHADNSISDHYRERFPDERLQAVSDHVHQWLFGKEVA